MKIMKNTVGKFAITWSDWVFVLRSDSLLIGGGGAERYGGPLRFGFCWRTGWGNLSDNMAIVRYEKLISNISDIYKKYSNLGNICKEQFTCGAPDPVGGLGGG